MNCSICYTFKEIVACLNTTVAVPSYLLWMSAGLTIFSTDSTTFLLPLTYFYGLINKQKDLSCLIITYHIITLDGLLRFHKQIIGLPIKEVVSVYIHKVTCNLMACHCQIAES